ncbi:MAG TPA: crotonase/enoyl-CoA hydratase family protein [Acidimicrobiales bacterium]|jgi:enoyl-CoA hydratase|nr:crotonase/enoyl-CoA hydratase family protein [Acidimicrobiales bacterium]
MGDLVTYSLADSIATIAMDDGKVNALSPEMLVALNEAFDQAADDKAIVILTGRPGVFSAGFHLPTLTGGGVESVDLLLGGFELSYRLLSFPTPVVVASTGHALAMASFLLLSGDYRIGADTDSKVGANEVAIGMVMPATAIEICRYRLAPAHFHRAVITAEIYRPAAAVEAGFLDAVVPESELAAAALDVAARLAKIDMTAHAHTKHRARQQMLAAMRVGMEADRTSMREALGV